MVSLEGTNIELENITIDLIVVPSAIHTLHIIIVTDDIITIELGDITDQVTKIIMDVTMVIMTAMVTTKVTIMVIMTMRVITTLTIMTGTAAIFEPLG
jgi:hypothetical protein